MAERTKGAMVILWTCTTFAISGTAVHGLLTTSQQAKSSARRFQAGDHELRAWASTSPLPICPSASLAKRVAGVCVATIRIDPKGAVEAVEIVQSPDTATG